MLVFFEQNLAFIAVPKTGTTALEAALRPRADIVFRRSRKHVTAQHFHRRFAPYLKISFGLQPERFAVIRDPEEQIRSWYKYRCRKDAKDGKRVEGLSFDRYVLDVISDKPPAHADIGSQFRLLTSARGKLLVHHLFAYDRLEVLCNFLLERFGEEIALPEMNVSPDIEAPLSPEVREKLRTARAREYALHARVLEAGGHLVTEI